MRSLSAKWCACGLRLVCRPSSSSRENACKGKAGKPRRRLFRNCFSNRSRPLRNVPDQQTKAEKPRFAEADSIVVLDARVVKGSGGGPDKTILNSPRHLAGTGYRMLCAYLHPPGDPGFAQLRRKAAALSAPLFSIPDRGPWDWKV